MRKIVTFLLALATLTGVAFAQNTGKWSFAYNFNYPPLKNYAQNTYIWPSPSICTIANPSSTNQGLNYFMFATNAPVWIQDVNTANSEVVTPSAITDSNTGCGFSATFVHTHNTFYATSGTAGLQEALMYRKNKNPFQATK